MKIKRVQRNYLRAKLLEKGLTLSQFAKENNLNYGTVQKVLQRYLGNPDCKPRGRLATRILALLNDYL